MLRVVLNATEILADMNSHKQGDTLEPEVVDVPSAGSHSKAEVQPM
jgi:hypothetical protein